MEMQGYDSGINIHHQQCTEYMYAGSGSCSGFIQKRIQNIIQSQTDMNDVSNG